MEPVGRPEWDVTWRDRVAFAASPWFWPGWAVGALGIVIGGFLVLGLASFFARAHDWGDVLSVPVGLLVWWLLAVRPYSRSLRRWRAEHDRGGPSEGGRA